MAPSSAELNTWAEIALHLKVSVRTAQNWEKDLGLPVKRITEGPRGRVFALVADLDHWKEERLHDSPGTSEPKEPIETAANAVPQSRSEVSSQPLYWIPRPSMLWTGGVLVLFALIVAARIVRPALAKTEPIAHVKLAGRSVEAQDGDGNTLWTYSFTQPFAPEAISYTKRSLADFVRVADLRDNGEQEVLIVAPFRFGPNPNDPATIKLVCFSDKGDVLWFFEPTASFQFGEHVLGDPWNILDVMVSKEKQNRSIWVAAGHSVWGNSIVFQVDPATGRGVPRFVNTGQLIALNEMKSGGRNFLLAGGFNNEYEMGTLAVVDESKPFAASPQTSGTRHECTNCPAGKPEYYFVFPHSELNVLAHDWLDGIYYVGVLGEDIDLAKHEVDRNFSAIARYLLQLEPTVHLVSLRYGSDYDLEHRKLERTGLIKHALADCPERLHNAAIRVWSEPAGWSDLAVRPALTGQ